MIIVLLSHHSCLESDVYFHGKKAKHVNFSSLIPVSAMIATQVRVLLCLYRPKPSHPAAGVELTH